MRRVVMVIAVLLLVLLPLLLAKKRKPDPVPPRVESPNPVTVLPKLVPIPESPREPDPARARRALGRCLQFMSFHHDEEWDGNQLARLHHGAYPAYRAFAREFLEAAGPDPLPLVRSLFEECTSKSAKFLLLTVLGDARLPASLSLLKEVVDERNFHQTAIYSIGMARSQEGFEFLMEELTRERTGAVFGDDSHYYTRLQAIALDGARSMKLIKDTARANGEGFGVDAEVMMSWIRGDEAVPELQKLFEKDEDESVRRGAALALGHSTDPETLRYWLNPARIDSAGWALAGPADLPDIWEPTAALRREIAERILPVEAPVVDEYYRKRGLIRLAALCGPARVRPYFERMAALDFADDLVHLFMAFADQPGLSVGVIEKARGGRPLAEIEGGTWREIADFWHPGKRIASPDLESALADLAVKRVEEEGGWEWLDFAMRVHIRQSTLSSALKGEWETMSPDRKINLLRCITESKGNAPADFLAAVLRDEPDVNLRLAAAAAYLRGGAEDTTAIRAIADLATRPEWEDSLQLRCLPEVLAAYYSRYGVSSDLSRLEILPTVFAYPEDEESLSRYQMKEACLRAVDAIRLSGR